MVVNSILAHQGGWDEILIIVGPIAAIVGIVALVRRRLHHEAAEEASESDIPPAPSDALGS